MTIKHMRADDTINGQTVYYDDYAVFDSTVLFRGTYTQCLTYIGAIVVGKAPIAAKNFATGFYH
jgi:hypothetical protein